ncbi:hypothetical protein CK203_101977 [Vitis vinifera]|uniref:ADP-ribosyl cyclase/cyclic ADP-ribose hydrolase n=1 Tax=Vitis vinifera TaxID=29760 RepID=A0A438BY93_VITVI|nr:hypothetical protein CK203_101977 [Vitis vinifera]
MIKGQQFPSLMPKAHVIEEITSVIWKSLNQELLHVEKDLLGMDRQRASSFSSIGPLEYEVFLIFWDEDEDARHNFIDHLYAVLHRKGNRNYVGSSWCLDELVKIMKCRKEMGKIIFPVFIMLIFAMCELRGVVTDDGWSI